jgi:hypothetical protein
VFENGVSGKIFETRKEKVAGSWRETHSEMIHNSHHPPNIITIIILWGMKWLGHITRMGEMRNVNSIL